MRATPLHVADTVEEAVVANLRLRFQQISMIETQLQEANRAMKELIQTIAANAKPAVDATSTEPASEPGVGDVEILSSLPGVGVKVLATLLSEASE